MLNNLQIDCKRFFWRTQQQQEVDYIEERDGKIHAYEFKWTEKKRHKIPLTFIKAYPEATSSMIHTDNYLNFLRGE
jgi:hypothetical protein